MSEPEGSRKLTPLQLEYLDRLKRILRLRRVNEPKLKEEGITLIDDQASRIFAECKEAGCEKEASQIIDDHKLIDRFTKKNRP